MKVELNQIGAQKSTPDIFVDCVMRKIQIISQATTLYHGTAADAVTNITEEGLRLSSIGHLGPGIYFVDTLDKAMKIAQGKHHNNWAVLAYL